MSDQEQYEIDFPFDKTMMVLGFMRRMDVKTGFRMSDIDDEHNTTNSKLYNNDTGKYFVKLWEQLASEMKELEDAAKQQVLFRNTSKVQRPDVVIKEMCDVLYTLHQLALAFGIDLDEAFRRVHEANMSKTDDEGYPIKDDNGKIQKGPNYKSPDLTGTF